jgi:hypothetical protein
VDRGRLRRTPGVRFAKLLGTGRGSGFGPAEADLTRWAALVVGEPVVPPMRGATAVCTLTLQPLASRGRWAGVEPFAARPEKRDGPLLVLTRARLSLRRAPVFWRAIGPVARELRGAEGLLAAFGVGEAPVGFQGTISVWRGAADASRFAYRQPEHAAVVARTPGQRWYSEELFARFHVLDVVGDRGVIGWKEGP